MKISEIVEYIAKLDFDQLIILSDELENEISESSSVILRRVKSRTTVDDDHDLRVYVATCMRESQSK